LTWRFVIADNGSAISFPPGAPPMKRSSVLPVTLFLLALATQAFAQGEAIDAKTFKSISQEIELVPSLYARFQETPKLKGMPKFAAAKLIGYGINDGQTVDKERKNWLANKAKYSRDYPLRAAIFIAADQMVDVQKLELRMFLARPITPQEKAAVMKEQGTAGIAAFRQEQALVQMKEAGEERDKEKNKRWQANYDFAHARVQSNLLFLIEYNYTLGRIRADNLPELGEGDEGWKINFRSNAQVTEAKAKDYAKDTMKRWQKIQADYPDTPWAYFAERESQRPLGMEWTPKKK
jgi:hypothetical protein